MGKVTFIKDSDMKLSIVNVDWNSIEQFSYLNFGDKFHTVILLEIGKHISYIYYAKEAVFEED